MSLTSEERNSLVDLRLSKATALLNEAEQMVKLHYWDMAANRFYYSCFHAAQALLVSHGYSAHTHEGTISMFGLHFVKTGLVSLELGAFFSRMEQLRKKADYNCNYDVTQAEVETMIAPAYGFVREIKVLVSKV